MQHHIIATNSHGPQLKYFSSDRPANGQIYGVVASIGSRVYMEDRHDIQEKIPQLPDWSFYAVFDGHGGCQVAELASESLLDQILGQEYMRTISRNRDFPVQTEMVVDAIHKGFISFEQKLHEVFDDGGFRTGGSTAVCVLISPQHFYFVNCGDSRAFLCRNGRVFYKTSDHKTSLPSEKARIEKVGGRIVDERIRGLAMSRALGDFMLKDIDKLGSYDDCIISKPDVTVVERQKQRDQYLFLASDGVFDVMSCKDVSFFLRREMRINNPKLGLVTKQLNYICRFKGSLDNITIIMVKFVNGPDSDTSE